jgi:protein-tyrosine-phosphatase
MATDDARATHLPGGSSLTGWTAPPREGGAAGDAEARERGRLVQWTKDAVRHVLERLEMRRAHSLRTNPVRLTSALRHARSVLVLCQGNVIRSVFSAHLLAAGLDGRRGVAVTSAGLATVAGWRAHPRVIARCADLDIDVRNHGSVHVTKAMMKAADVVLVMEVSQLVVVTRHFFAARRKTFLLTSLAPDVPLEIADPAGQSDAAVDGCLDQIVRAVQPLIEVLAGPDSRAKGAR